MDADRYRRLEELFHAAVAVPEPERDAFIEQHCRDDDALAAELRQLLDEDAVGTKPYLESPVTGLTAAWDPDAMEDAIPEYFDRYRLIEQIGQGGMGTVHRAQQIEPVQRSVVIKLPFGDTVAPEVAERFHRERQALASLNHPNIIKLFDAGSTPSGKPFLVMEDVTGTPLLDYVDAESLGERDVAALVLGVAEALAHAHEQGVVHCDVKPSNVLVANEGGAPTAKLIDFGAAVTAGDASERSSPSGTTPTYASPEQQDGHAAKPTTDVYSLGVTFAKILRGSKRAADLEAMIERATADEVADRYPTARDLADDIRRWLSHRAIEGVSLGPVYRARKFVRRRWLEIAMVVVVAGLALQLMRSPPARTSPPIATSGPTTPATVQASAVGTVERESHGDTSRWLELITEAVHYVRSAEEPTSLRGLVEALANAPPSKVCEKRGRIRQVAGDALDDAGAGNHRIEAFARVIESELGAPALTRGGWMALAFRLWREESYRDDALMAQHGVAWFKALARTGMLVTSLTPDPSPTELLPQCDESVAKVLSANIMEFRGFLQEHFPDQAVVHSSDKLGPKGVYTKALQSLSDDTPGERLARSLLTLRLASLEARRGNATEAKAHVDAVAAYLAEHALEGSVWHAVAASIRGEVASLVGHADATRALESAHNEIHRLVGPTALATRMSWSRLIRHYERSGADETALATAQRSYLEATAMSEGWMISTDLVGNAFGPALALWLDRLKAIATTVDKLVKTRQDGPWIKLLDAIATDKTATEPALLASLVCWKRATNNVLRVKGRLTNALFDEFFERAHASVAPHRDRVPRLYTSILRARVARLVRARHFVDAERAWASLGRLTQTCDTGEESTEEARHLGLVCAALRGDNDASFDRALQQWRSRMQTDGPERTSTVDALETVVATGILTGKHDAAERAVSEHLDTLPDVLTEDHEALLRAAATLPKSSEAFRKRVLILAKKAMKGIPHGCAIQLRALARLRVGELVPARRLIARAIEAHGGFHPLDWAIAALIARARDDKSGLRRALKRMNKLFDQPVLMEKITMHALVREAYADGR